MIVFHHIPRTGGISISYNIIKSNLDLDYIRIDDVFKTNNMEKIPNNYDFIYGHFDYNKIPDNCFKFTFIRHPISRLNSLFYFFKKIQLVYNFGHLELLPETSLTILIGSQKCKISSHSPFFANSIEKFIDEFLDSNGTFNMNFISEIFVPNYGKFYDFVGLTEKMPESISRLNKHIKLDTKNLLVLNNSNPKPLIYKYKELEVFYEKDIEIYKKILEQYQ